MPRWRQVVQSSNYAPDRRFVTRVTADSVAWGMTNDDKADKAIAIQAVYDALLKSKQSNPPHGEVAGEIDKCLHELEGDLRRLEREILLAQ